MKKVLITLAVSCGIIFGSFAQTTTSSSATGIKFNIGVELGYPLDDAYNYYDAVKGWSIKIEFPVSKDAYFTAGGGYNLFTVKSKFMTARFSVPSSGFVPIKAGIKDYPFGSVFFIEGQAGIAFFTDNGGGNSFAWSAGLGCTLPFGVEAGLRFEDWPNGPLLAAGRPAFGLSVLKLSGDSKLGWNVAWVKNEF